MLEVFLLMIACIKSCIAENSAAVEKRLVTLIISRFPTGTSKAKKGKLPSGPTYTVGKNYKSCFFLEKLAAPLVAKKKQPKSKIDLNKLVEP